MSITLLPLIYSSIPSVFINKMDQVHLAVLRDFTIDMEAFP
jgi:hypothetical protein